MRTILSIAMAAGLILGTAMLAHAQTGGGTQSGGAAATTGSQPGSTLNKLGTPDKNGSSTAGQGQRSRPNDSEYDPPVPNSATTNDKNPGNAGTPPRQQTLPPNRE